MQRKTEDINPTPKNYSNWNSCDEEIRAKLIDKKAVNPVHSSFNLDKKC